jgi:hypothetical protein
VRYLPPETNIQGVNNVLPLINYKHTLRAKYNKDFFVRSSTLVNYHLGSSNKLETGSGEPNYNGKQMKKVIGVVK